MITAVLIDDESDALACLKWELDNFKEEIKVIATFNQAPESIKFLEQNQVDAVFLDVEMPEMNGFEFLSHFDKRKFAVIITTAHQDYAISAIKKQCLDFLQKPVDGDALKDCIEKIKNYKKEHLLIDYFEETLYKKADKDNLKKITVNTDGKIIFLNPNDILYCESEGNYVTIFFEKHKPLTFTGQLKHLEEKLNEDFFRIHNSYIVNLNKVQEYLKNDGYVVLNNSVKIPVSRQKKSTFLDKF